MADGFAEKKEASSLLCVSQHLVTHAGVVKLMFVEDRSKDRWRFEVQEMMCVRCFSGSCTFCRVGSSLSSVPGMTGHGRADAASNNLLSCRYGSPFNSIQEVVFILFGLLACSPLSAESPLQSGRSNSKPRRVEHDHSCRRIRAKGPPCWWRETPLTR